MKTCLAQLVLITLMGTACFVARVGAGGPEKGKFTLSTTEEKILELTNKERAKVKLAPLRPSPILFRVARAHSANMAKQGKMDHVLDGKNPFQRIKAAGYAYFRAGENVAYDEGGVMPARIMKGWMESKYHRENILNPAYTEIGLGVVSDPKGVAYYTQVFGRPRSAPSRQ
jgi:uncharacterized protein YkwD